MRGERDEEGEGWKERNTVRAVTEPEYPCPRPPQT